LKPAPFEYLAPNTLEEALSCLQDGGSDAKVLAGGQSLVPAMNFRLAQPAILVDINKLKELDTIRPADGSGLRIGAIARQRRVELDPTVSEQLPLLAEAMQYVAHPQIRNRGTLGGSMAHADPAAELPVVALALEARFKLCRAGGERWVPAESFFQGLFTTALQPDELLIEVELPSQPGTGWAFLEFSRRQGDYALMGVAALVGLDEQGLCRKARLVYLNAGESPVVAHGAAALLQGERLTEAAIEAAAVKASEEEIEPWGNVHATPAYQRHLARVLTRRALRLAGERAAGPGN
jgi:carbon-monoxide dehydrogenase medium subunit